MIVRVQVAVDPEFVEALREMTAELRARATAGWLKLTAAGSPAVESCPSCQAELPPGEMACPECGKEIDVNVTRVLWRALPVPKPRLPSRQVLAVLAAVGACFAFGVGLSLGRLSVPMPVAAATSGPANEAARSNQWVDAPSTYAPPVAEPSATYSPPSFAPPSFAASTYAVRSRTFTPAFTPSAMSPPAFTYPSLAPPAPYYGSLAGYDREWVRGWAPPGYSGFLNVASTMDTVPPPHLLWHNAPAVPYAARPVDIQWMASYTSRSVLFPAARHRRRS